MVEFIGQPFDASAVGEHLRNRLADDGWQEFRAAVAFVKLSGVRHIARELTGFSARGSVRITVGVDAQGTSVEGLRALLGCMRTGARVWVYHNEGAATFHPKVYLFRNDARAELLVGSSNLTEGGLYTNYEAGLLGRLDLSQRADRSVLQRIEHVLDRWSTDAGDLALPLSSQAIEQLAAQGYVVPEAVARAEEAVSRPGARRRPVQDRLFGRAAVSRPPRISARDLAELLERAPGVLPESRMPSGFVMTLQRADVGVGQVTPGTSRRSPEVFVPLAARDYAPRFWGWPGAFTPDPARAGKMDRPGVRFRIGTSVAEVNMMTWPVKHDFRLRSEALRSAGTVGDILRMERGPGGSSYDYYAEVVPQGTSLYDYHRSLCSERTPGSQRTWGYY